MLETVANPYTTILGTKGVSATRINLAQSFNGVGWIFGPIVGAAYFYSEGGVQKAHGQLFIPYLGVAIVVLIIAAMFFGAQVPDVKVEDEYHTDDTKGPAVPVKQEHNRGLIVAMMFLNVAAAGLSLFLILHTILQSLMADHANATEVEASIQTVLREAMGCRWCTCGVIPSGFALRSTKKVTNPQHLGSPSFFGSHARAVFLRGGAGGHFQFLHQQHDGGQEQWLIASVPSLSAGGRAKQRISERKIIPVEHRVALAPGDLRRRARRWRSACRAKVRSRSRSGHLAENLSADTQKLAGQAAIQAWRCPTALLRDLNEPHASGRLEPERWQEAGAHDAQRFVGTTLSATTQQAYRGKSARPTTPALRSGPDATGRCLPEQHPPTTTPAYAISDSGAGFVCRPFAFGLLLLGRLWRGSDGQRISALDAGGTS